MINNKISPWQFSIIIFLCTMAPMAFISGEMLGNNISDTVFSLILALVLVLITALPFLFINKEPENKIINIAYVLFFSVLTVSDSILVSKMLINTLIPEGSGAFISVFMLIIAFYGGYKGVECLARSSQIILFFFLLGAFFIMTASIPNIKKECYLLPFENGYKDFYYNALSVFSVASFVPQFYILRKKVNGKFRIKSVISIVTVFILSELFFLLVQYTLGYYALTQQYPLYTLSAVTAAPPLKRLDLIFTVIFIMAVVLRFSVGFSSVFTVCEKIGISKKLKIILSVFIISSASLFSFFETYITGAGFILFRAILLVLFSVLIPLIYGIYENHKRKVAAK